MGIGASLLYNGTIFTTGDKITCKIHHTFIGDARIYVLSSCYEDRHCGHHLDYPGKVLFEAYICQDVKHGTSGPNNLGYKEGWVFTIVDNHGNIELTEDVSELKLMIKDELAHIVQLAFAPKLKQRTPYEKFSELIGRSWHPPHVDTDRLDRYH